MGLGFLQDSAGQGREARDGVTRPERGTGLYVQPMGPRVEVRPSELFWAPCPPVESSFPYPGNPGGVWQTAGQKFLCKAMVMAHQS